MINVLKKHILLLITLCAIICVAGKPVYVDISYFPDDNISAHIDNDFGQQHTSEDKQLVTPEETPKPLNTPVPLETPSPLETPKPQEPEILSRISNPYENVDWDTFGQYRAANHIHTSFTDGNATLKDAIIDLYNKGYDIVSIADHMTTTSAWDTAPDRGYSEGRRTALLTSEELSDITNGTYDASGFSGAFTGRREQPNGMIGTGSTNEIHAGKGYQSGVFTDHHINSYFADVPAKVGNGKTMAEVIEYVQSAGGITHINHPGRYTGMNKNAAAAKNNPKIVERYVQLFMDFPSLVGMEIISKWDYDSVNDRIFWDYILMQTMPHGRFVWCFSNDDSHSLYANGHAWNVMLMPALSESDVRMSMENGTFYSVSRVDRHHGVNSKMPNGRTTPEMPTSRAHNLFALQLLSEKTPVITSIVVNGNTISISGNYFDKIIWIADGETVHTGDSIDIDSIIDINSYIRAELIGPHGVAYTQPFGISD